MERKNLEFYHVWGNGSLRCAEPLERFAGDGLLLRLFVVNGASYHVVIAGGLGCFHRAQVVSLNNIERKSVIVV